MTPKQVRWVEEDATAGGRRAAPQGSLEHTLSEQRLLRTHLPAAKYTDASEQVVRGLQRALVDAVRLGQQAVPVEVQRLFQGVMYLLGHKVKEVEEWERCRKLVPRHITKEMCMIDPRAKRDPRCFLLASTAIHGLTEAGGRLRCTHTHAHTHTCTHTHTRQLRWRRERTRCCYCGGCT